MLEALPLSEVSRGGEVLAEAFMADPMFRFLLPRESRRRSWLRTLMGANLRMLSASGHAHRTQGDGFGVIGLAPPGAFPPPGGRALRMAIDTGWSTLRERMSPRSMHAGLHVVRAMERLHPSAPHWYLHVLGVHPQGQGRGLGAGCLRFAVERADRDGLPLYLETSNPDNLGFYRHFGFEVREEVHGPHAVPPMWTMERPAA